MKPQTIIFIGRSGCGKGTQAKLVEEHIQKNDTEKREIYYLETGAGFREFLKGDSHTSKLSKEIYLRSDRLPDYLATWMWSHQLVEKTTGEEHLLVDGTPRSLLEAMVLNSALGFYKRPANVVHIDVSRQTALDRLLSRGRSDDDTVQINKRLDWYDKDVAPGVEYFRAWAEQNPAACTFIEVSGEQDTEKVHADIVAGVKMY